MCIRQDYTAIRRVLYIYLALHIYLYTPGCKVDTDVVNFNSRVTDAIDCVAVHGQPAADPGIAILLPLPLCLLGGPNPAP